MINRAFLLCRRIGRERIFLFVLSKTIFFSSCIMICKTFTNILVDFSNKTILFAEVLKFFEGYKFLIRDVAVIVRLKSWFLLIGIEAFTCTITNLTKAIYA